MSSCKYYEIYLQHYLPGITSGTHTLTFKFKNNIVWQYGSISIAIWYGSIGSSVSFPFPAVYTEWTDFSGTFTLPEEVSSAWLEISLILIDYSDEDGRVNDNQPGKLFQLHAVQIDGTYTTIPDGSFESGVLKDSDYSGTDYWLIHSSTGIHARIVNDPGAAYDGNKYFEFFNPSNRVRYSDGREEILSVPVPFTAGEVVAVTHRRDGGVVVQRVSSVPP